MYSNLLLFRRKNYTFPYRCSICNRGFRYKERFEGHMREHDGKRVSISTLKIIIYSISYYKRFNSGCRLWAVWTRIFKVVRSPISRQKSAQKRNEIHLLLWQTVYVRKWPNNTSFDSQRSTAISLWELWQSFSGFLSTKCKLFRWNMVETN